jgi:hypothetical protein
VRPFLRERAGTSRSRPSWRTAHDAFTFRDHRHPCLYRKAINIIMMDSEQQHRDDFRPFIFPEISSGERHKARGQTAPTEHCFQRLENTT